MKSYIKQLETKWIYYKIEFFFSTVLIRVTKFFTMLVNFYPNNAISKSLDRVRTFFVVGGGGGAKRIDLKEGNRQQRYWIPWFNLNEIVDIRTSVNHGNKSSNYLDKKMLKNLKTRGFTITRSCKLQLPTFRYKILKSPESLYFLRNKPLNFQRQHLKGLCL